VAKDGRKHLAVITEMHDRPIDKQEVATVPLTSNPVWLRAEVPYLEYAVNYSYSTDGKTFKPLGEKLGMPFEFFWDWLGPRYCIYNYATQETGGHVDVDSFDYILPKQKNNLHAFGDPIDTQFYDEISNPRERTFTWVDDGMNNFFLRAPRVTPVATGRHGPFSWAAAYEAKQAGNWVKFASVDFAKGAKAICVRVRGQGHLSIHSGDENGAVIAQGAVSSDDFTTVELRVKRSPQGVQPITVVFTPRDEQSIVLSRLLLK
jgi:hypothetical protein